MDQFFKSSHLIKLIIRWRWHLLVILAASVLVSVVFSGPAFIPPKYKSYAVIYPANLTPYSSETQTEQLLQLLKSEDIVYSMVNRFALYKHYKVDTGNPDYRYVIKSKFDDNVTIRKTEYESVLIEVLDKDPGVACDMVNELINLMNLKARNLQREKTAEIVRINYDLLMMKKAQIDSVEARLKVMRNDYNILDYFIQTKELTKGMVKSVNSGRNKPDNEIFRTLENLRKYGGEQRLLESELFSLTASYNDIKKDYDKSISDLNKELTYANVVTTPVPADRKSYPIRWLIVLGFTASTLLLSMLLFSFVRERKWKVHPEASGQKL